MRKLFLYIITLTLGFIAAESSTKETDKPIIVFDFGGVMVDFDIQKMLEYCAGSFDMSLSEFKIALKKDIGRLAIGEVKEKAFWLEFARNNQLVFPSHWKDQYKNFIKKIVEPRNEMYSFLEQLKAEGYQVAMLSDVTEWQAEAFQELGLYEGFYPLILSCNIGARKPNQKAYQTLLDNLNACSENVIFVDDRPMNIEGAETVGIRAILYANFKDTKDALKLLIE